MGNTCPSRQVRRRAEISVLGVVLLVMFLLITGCILWDQGKSFIETALGFTFSIDAQRYAALLHATAAIAAIVIWICTSTPGSGSVAPSAP